MASIKKKGTGYLLIASNGRDSNGKQIVSSKMYHPKATTPAAAKKEAQAAAEQWEQEVKTDGFMSGQQRLQQFIENQWMEWAQKHLTTNVREGYQDYFKNNFYPTLGKMKLSDIKVRHLQTLVNEWNAAGLAPETVRRRIAAINSVMVRAYRWELIQENPCDRLELPKNKKDDKLHYFTVEQSEMFLADLDRTFTFTYKEHTRTVKNTGRKYTVSAYTESYGIQQQFKPYFYLAIYGSFRRGEIIALTWHDINFDNNTVSITKAVTKTKEGQLIKEPKTKSSVRTITLPPIVFQQLAAWKSEQMRLFMQNQAAWPEFNRKDYDSNWIFIQLENGSRMDVDTPTHRFRDILSYHNKAVDQALEHQKDGTATAEEMKVTEADRLPVIRLHDLRHTSATILLANHVDIETVSHRLGHSHASVTLDVYGHAMKEMDQTAADTLATVFAAKQA